jgi:hypothetical protein
MHPEVHRRRTAREKHEHVSLVIAVVPDGQLVREVAHGHVRFPAEYQPRILVVPDMVAEALFEIAALFAFRAKPGDGPIREHAVQDHQAFDRPLDRDSPAVPIVRLTDGRVQRLVVNVEDPRPSGRTELNRSNEPPDQQFHDEVVNLLPVRDVCERRVLPADKHSGVQHDSRQEASLTLCETKGDESLDALTCGLVRLQHVRRRWWH